jgi:hypothetical protein
MKPFQSILAAALCAAAIGVPVSSPARVFGNELSAEEQDLYVREQSIREEIEQMEEEKRKIWVELETFKSSIKSMKTEALANFREKLRRPGLSDAEKDAIRSAYEKQCEEIEAKLVEKKRQTETASAPIEKRIGDPFMGTGLYRELGIIAKDLQKTVEKEASDALSRLLDNGMVSIPGKDYRMGRYEVDQALWQAVMGKNPSEYKGAHRPVEYVSWDDVQEFLRKLNVMPDVIERDIEFRLPTEQEWKYACRAGAIGDYCKLADGTEISESTLGQIAWFDNSNKKTHPVGQKQPNAFGLYDMHGNVAEWTSTAASNSFGREARVTCGGDYISSAGSCESSYRVLHVLAAQWEFLGFRLCAEAVAK